MNLHKGKIIRSGINTGNFVGILDGSVDLLLKVLIMSKTSSVEIWEIMKFSCRSYRNIPFCGGPYIYKEVVKFVRDINRIVNYFSINI